MSKNIFEINMIDTTTHFYLRDIIKEQNLKCDIIMRDELLYCKARQSPYLDKDNLIINLQTSNEKGSHWILASKKYNIYFDSYGVLQIKEIYRHFNSLSKVYTSWVCNTVMT